MAERILSSSTVALIHHVELHESGWWDSAVGRMILATLRDSTDPLPAELIRTILEGAYGLRLLVPTIELHLQALVDKGQVLKATGGYVLSTETRRQCDQEVETAALVEKRARAVFIQSIQEACPSCSAPEIWLVFRDQCLIPMVRAEGAEVLRFASGGQNGHAPGEIFNSFVENADVDDKPALAEAVASFLESTDVDVRDFVLSYLDAHFVVVATGLDDVALKNLAPNLDESLEMTVMLDTNYLFSALGLHDNPSNEAARALLRLGTSDAGAVKLRFGVLPVTIEETRQALTRKVENMAPIRWSMNLATAALSIGMPGFMEGYLAEIAAQGGSMTFSEYGEMLVRDIEPRLNALGIEVFDCDEDYSTRHDVLDDLMGQLEYQERLPEERRRTYEQHRHDMILYHWVTDRRPPAVSASPLEGKFWIATLDGMFLAFDRHKTNGGRSSGAICMHPSTLLQVLQFWSPRSEEFSDALFGTVRLPLLAGQDLTGTERVTLGIIRRLGDIKGIESLSEQSIVATLLDKAVNQQFQLAQSDEEEVEAIESGLAAALRERELELEAERLRTKSLEDVVHTRDETLAIKDAHLTGRARQVEKLESRIERLNNEKTGLKTHLSSVGTEVQELQKALDVEREALLRMRWFLVWVAGVGLGVAVLGAALTVLGTYLLSIMWWKIAVVVYVSLLSGWLRVLFEKGDSVPGLMDHRWFIRLRKPARWSWTVAVAAIGLVVSERFLDVFNAWWR